MQSKIIFCFILLFIGTRLNAQKAGKSDSIIVVAADSIKSKTDRMAEFPGGEMAFLKYISKHFKYPKNCLEKNISCQVVVRFVVDTDGKVLNASIVESCAACKEIDAEAIWVVLSSPKWKPAIYDGRKVKAWRQVPISLRIE
ncbi:MAG: energy transducer TonB [Bacteroidetes bacterium]|nr:energy transducer TonB [Bacteroidota bacterium]